MSRLVNMFHSLRNALPLILVLLVGAPLSAQDTGPDASDAGDVDLDTTTDADATSDADMDADTATDADATDDTTTDADDTDVMDDAVADADPDAMTDADAVDDVDPDATVDADTIDDTAQDTATDTDVVDDTATDTNVDTDVEVGDDTSADADSGMDASAMDVSDGSGEEPDPIFGDVDVVLDGVVLTAAGEPAAGAVVRLTGLGPGGNEDVSESVATDDAGVYSITVPAGWYRVRASLARGSFDETAEIDRLRLSEDETLRIRLVDPSEQPGFTESGCSTTKSRAPAGLALLLIGLVSVRRRRRC